MVSWTAYLSILVVAVLLFLIHSDIYRYLFTSSSSSDCLNVLQPSELLNSSLYLVTQRSNSATLISDLLWEMNGIPYKKLKPVVNTTITIPVPSDLSENKTHYFLRMTIRSLSPPNKTVRLISPLYPLIQWFRHSGRRKHNLLDSTKSPLHTPFPFHYKTARFDLLYEDRPRNRATIGVEMKKSFTWNMKQLTFQPPVAPDTFFEVPKQRIPINLSESNFTVRFEFNIRGEYLWYFKSLLDQTFDISNEVAIRQWRYLKSLFIDANPILLWTTMIATVFHTIFELLAFKRDLQFWRKKSSFVGVSLRSLTVRFVSQIILFAYVFVNEPDISNYILAIHFGEIVLELWKIGKLVRFVRRIPFVEVREEYQGETDEADAQGLKYLVWILIPLIIGYGVWQLLYGKHTGYGAYLLHCAAGALYAFGFLLMLPQLYVNYRLKTVAGMSRAALAYKCVNTFIDDMYAFLSSRSLMYKIACFRDDVVFVIWIVQCWIYPVDPSRLNEFDLVLRLVGDEVEDKGEGESEDDEKQESLKDESGGKKIKTD
jgi:hypothetical protein